MAVPCFVCFLLQMLEEQIAEREAMRYEAYNELIKEREMVDAVVRKIQEEDERYAWRMFVCLSGCFPITDSCSVCLAVWMVCGVGG